MVHSRRQAGKACALRKTGGADGGGGATIAGGARRVSREDWRGVHGAKPSTVAACTGTCAWRAHRQTSLGGVLVQLLQRESGKCAQFGGTCGRSADGYWLLPGSNVAIHFWRGARPCDGLRGA